MFKSSYLFLVATAIGKAGAFSFNPIPGTRAVHPARLKERFRLPSSSVPLPIQQIFMRSVEMEVGGDDDVDNASGPGRHNMYDDAHPAPGMSGVARPPPLGRSNEDASSSASPRRTASSINQPLVRSARGTNNDPVAGGTWWEAAGVAAYATKGQMGNFETFTDQQRQLSRTESQERTNPNMPRRVRTESGYAPGSPQHSAGRDLSTNYGPGPGRNAQAGSNAGFAADGDGAHNSWWDSTGRSQDASHGTQGNFQTFTDRQRRNSRPHKGQSPEYRYY